MKRYLFLLFYSLAAPLFSCFVGNPASVNLYEKGLFSSSDLFWSFRAGYLYENVYKVRYKDRLQSLDSTPSNVKMDTQAALLTLNFFNWWDIYGIVGGSKIQLDNLIVTDRQTSWAVGTKFLLFKFANLYVGLDGKYFQTDQKVSYFLINKQVAPLLTPFSLHFHDYQAALGIAYDIQDFLIPYMGVTYFYSLQDPKPTGGIYRDPTDGLPNSFPTKVAISRKNWGLYLGVTILSVKKASLTLETRMFDQNSFNIAGEIRF